MTVLDKWDSWPLWAKIVTAGPVAGLALLAGYIIGALMMIVIGYVAWRYGD